MPKYNSMFGVATSFVKLQNSIGGLSSKIRNSDPDAMIPFMVMHGDEVIGFFVPANTTQAFQALSGQILPQLNIYRNFPAIQVLNPEFEQPPNDPNLR